MLWYTARGAGLTAMVLLSVATAGGAVQSMRTLRADTRVVLQYVHRAAAVAGLLVVLVHVVTIVLDPQAGVGVSGAVVPFTSNYSPLTVGLGTLALYGFIGVAALGAARRRMAQTVGGTRVWRALHLTSYGSWAIAVVHGFTTGTDTGRAWAIALTAAGVLLVVAAVVARVIDASRPRPAHRPARPRRIPAAVTR